VITFRDTSIYATDSDERAGHVVASDPRGRFHKVHHEAGNPSGTYEDDSSEYWRRITDALTTAAEILLVGHGEGRADATRQWLTYAEHHRREVAEKVVGDVKVDLDHLDDEQIFRLAQEHFDVAPPRDFGDSRRGEA